ncbi:Retrovirus-related Pol polyprotein from transposon 297 [Araneus ventricosus]|uniref:RNA-directed DNA polymerase n=1 Tax=Araneus ventricosus TaxID=182803 RepID=A0A4Y2W703_ARAVE|nr:Retrovirus-related Pol polyprotein from transposon 297 [Araneus ventricosus]
MYGRLTGRRLPFLNKAPEEGLKVSALCGGRNGLYLEESICGCPRSFWKIQIRRNDFSSQVSQKGVLVAGTLVDLKREAIPVRVLNLDNKPKTVDKRAVIATCEPVVDIVARPQEFSESLRLPSILENLEVLNEEQRTAVKELLQEFQHLFSTSDSDVGRCNMTQHRIHTGNHPPIKQYPRRLPLAKKEEAERLVKEMVDNGIIDESSGPWASPFVLVKKKDGSTRFCVDYRKLNEITIKDSYPLPRIDDTLDALNGRFSTLDLKSGYWQVEIQPEDKEKTAFTTGQGLWQFKEVSYVGHIISADGVKTDPEKTRAVVDWPPPETVHDLRSFLGLCTYYRRFVRNFSAIARPLHKLTEARSNFNWTEECEKSFNSLKQALISSPVLTYPRTDKGFILDADASNEGIGTVLSQKIGNEECVIAYFSKSLDKPERNYCVTRKELLAIVKSIEHFHHYLYGQKFLLRTDHASLRWLLNFREPEGQIARWIQRLQEYDFEIQHRKGTSHGNADALSRRPCKESCKHCTNAKKKFGMEIDISAKVLTTEGPWSSSEIQKAQSADHEVTRFTPTDMLFGRTLRLPCDILFGRPSDTPSSPNEYFNNLEALLESVHVFARERIKLASERMKTRYDSGATGRHFKEGDQVWMYNPKRRRGLSPKLQQNWEGP